MANYNERRRSNNSPLISILVGLLVVVVIIFAWLAYSGRGDLTYSTGVGEENNSTQSGANESRDVLEQSQTAEAEVGAARFDARAELLNVQTELAAEENYAEVIDEVEQIESELETAYERAGAAYNEEWLELSMSFDTFESRLRAGTADALDALEAILTNLEADVVEDEDPRM